MHTVRDALAACRIHTSTHLRARVREVQAIRLSARDQSAAGLIRADGVRFRPRRMMGRAGKGGTERDAQRDRSTTSRKSLAFAAREFGSRNGVCPEIVFARAADSPLWRTIERARRENASDIVVLPCSGTRCPPLPPRPHVESLRRTRSASCDVAYTTGTHARAAIAVPSQKHLSSS